MKKRRYITKILVFILVLGISFVNIGSFDVEAAANNKEEKKAKKVVTAYMHNAKVYNPDKMKKYFIQKPKYAYAKYFVKLFRGKNKKYLTYKIKSVAIKNKKGIIKVKVTQPDYYVAFLLGTDNYLCWFSDYYDIHDKYPATKTAGKKYRKYIKKSVKAHGMDTVTRTVKFKMKKTKKGWKIVKGTKSIRDIASAQLNRATDDAYWCFENDENIYDYIDDYEEEYGD